MRVIIIPKLSSFFYTTETDFGTVGLLFGTGNHGKPKFCRPYEYMLTVKVRSYTRKLKQVLFWAKIS